jgi:hypothetical protein
VFGHILGYIAMLFMSGAMVLVDNGLHLAQHEIKKLVELKEKQRQKKLREQKLQDHAVQRKRITNLIGKLFL